MRTSIIIGFLAGIASALALAYTAPFLPHDRVRSETEVRNNGGRFEQFEVAGSADVLALLPAGGDAQTEAVPSGARWYPDLAPFSGEAAVYRLRNASGVVIGVASRVKGVESPDDVQWVLHIPARGTIALKGAGIGDAEIGSVVAGEREFSGLVGEWQATAKPNGGWRIETLVIVPEPPASLQAAGDRS
ncbi:MAG: hypothetical protein AAF229_03320 [Pseudomonadota bacterium]